MNRGYSDMHRLQDLVRLHREGRSTRDIARLLGMSPNTERPLRLKLLAAGLLDGDPAELPELDTLRAAVHNDSRQRPPQEVFTTSNVARLDQHAGVNLDPAMGGWSPTQMCPTRPRSCDDECRQHAAGRARRRRRFGGRDWTSKLS
jgi:hypothetical protein